MALRYRLMILGLLALITMALYGLGRFYSPSLMTYVVKQTLIEKAPPGTDNAMLKRRFEAVFSHRPTEDKLQRLLRLSQYLEKVQELTRPELELLLQESSGSSSTGTFKESLELFVNPQCLILQG